MKLRLIIGTLFLLLLSTSRVYADITKEGRSGDDVKGVDMTIYRGVNELTCHPQNPLMMEAPLYTALSDQGYPTGYSTDIKDKFARISQQLNEPKVEGYCASIHGKADPEFVGRNYQSDSNDPFWIDPTTGLVAGRGKEPQRHYYVLEIPNPAYCPPNAGTACTPEGNIQSFYNCSLVDNKRTPQDEKQMCLNEIAKFRYAKYLHIEALVNIFTIAVSESQGSEVWYIKEQPNENSNKTFGKMRLGQQKFPSFKENLGTITFTYDFINKRNLDNPTDDIIGQDVEITRNIWASNVTTEFNNTWSTCADNTTMGLRKGDTGLPCINAGASLTKGILPNGTTAFKKIWNNPFVFADTIPLTRKTKPKTVKTEATVINAQGQPERREQYIDPMSWMEYNQDSWVRCKDSNPTGGSTLRSVLAQQNLTYERYIAHFNNYVLFNSIKENEGKINKWTLNELNNATLSTISVKNRNRYTIDNNDPSGLLRGNSKVTPPIVLPSMPLGCDYPKLTQDKIKKLPGIDGYVWDDLGNFVMKDSAGNYRSGKRAYAEALVKAFPAYYGAYYSATDVKLKKDAQGNDMYFPPAEVLISVKDKNGNEVVNSNGEQTQVILGKRGTSTETLTITASASIPNIILNQNPDMVITNILVYADNNDDDLTNAKRLSSCASNTCKIQWSSSKVADGEIKIVVDAKSGTRTTGTAIVVFCKGPNGTGQVCANPL